MSQQAVGCFPGRIIDLSVEPDCLKVGPGCVGGRLHIMNKCGKDFIVTKIDSNSKEYSAYFCVGTGKCGWFEINSDYPECSYKNFTETYMMGNKGVMTIEHMCSNVLITSYEHSSFLIEGFGVGRFELSSNKINITGSFI